VSTILPVAPADYTEIGYDALRASMLEHARARVPEWTDQSENDLGVLLIELFAYACDLTLYYQTRIAANLLPETSDEPAALLQLLRLIGYELRPPAPATADLRLGFDLTGPPAPPITIPAGTVFTATLTSGEDVRFEAVRTTVIDAAHLKPGDPADPLEAGLDFFFPLPVVEGRSFPNQLLGVSDGSPNQRYEIPQKRVIARSIVVRVQEPGATTEWEEVESFADSTPADRHVVVQRFLEPGAVQSDGAAAVLFGDGTNGMKPPAGTTASPVRIFADFRVGGGPEANVPAETVFDGPSFVRLATNPNAASGGMVAEDVARARRLAPRLFRTQERGVTLRDHEDVALHVPGVGKARAVAINFNEIAIFVAPSGQVGEPSEFLKRDLLAAFERRRMAATFIRVYGPTPADVYLGARIQAQPYFLVEDVRAAAERAVAEYLAFENVDFGTPVFLSRVYDAIQDLEQVVSLEVTEFARTPGGGIAGIIELGPHEIARLGYRDNPATPPDPTNPSNRPPIVLEIVGGRP
jgi:hypothetical protein